MLISEIMRRYVECIAICDIQLCAICGAIVNCITKKEALSGNFNDYQYFRYHSDYICTVCHACMRDNGFKGHALRHNSIIANPNEIRILKKVGIAESIFSPLEPPFIFLVSFSKKKHIFIHTKVNYSKDPIYIATDKQDINIELSKFKPLYEACNSLYQSGFSKSEIESGYYKKLSLIESLPNFYDCEHVIRCFRGQFLLQFTTFTLSKETDNDKD